MTYVITQSSGQHRAARRLLLVSFIVALCAGVQAENVTRTAASAAALGEDLAPLVTQGKLDTAQRKLGDQLSAQFGAGGSVSQTTLACSGVTAALAQHEFIRACGADKLSDLAGREGGAAFLTAFLGDAAWVESFLISDPPTDSYAQAAQNLYLLHRHGKDLDRPVYRRMATALALSAGKMLPYRLVDRFAHTQRAHRELLLHAGFDTMDVREMRWAIYLGGNAREYQYLLDDRQDRIGDYLGACWAVWYRDPNDYADSVQTHWYHLPWRHALPGWEAPRAVGGVCGALSTYGSMVARAHGVMSTPVGQPGHCAYVVRIGDEWPVGNSVTWPTGFGAPGWEGTGYATAHRLYEPVSNDVSRVLAANRLLWAARLQADRSRPQVRMLPGLRYTLYREGVGAALPDFAKLKPTSTGDAKSFDLAAVTPPGASNFGVVWEGECEVSGAGMVRVSTQSDDSSRVWVDNQPVVEANCSRQEKEIVLQPGKHAVRVGFSQGGGALHLHANLEGVLPMGKWAGVYEQAIEAQPLNFAVWLAYIKALEGVPGVPPKTWLDLSRRAAKTFAPYQEAAWALVHRTFDKALPTLKPEERVAFLLECHQELRQEKAERFEGYPYDGVLNWQADRLGGDAALPISYFGRVLQTHAAKPPHDWVFGQVLNWGQNRFAANPKTASDFARAMDAYFRAQGAGVSQDMVRNQIAGGIRRACDAGDLASCRLWSDMAEKMLPALQPGDVHFNPQQAAAFPKFDPFPGDVLSKDGLLRISSVEGADRPLSYRALLSKSAFGGIFHTGAEDNPWAQVQLAGDAELSGIVLVNRYEACAERQAPLKVSISTDGKAWTEVAAFDKQQPVFRVDLQAKKPRARYVRVERPAGRRDCLHFRNMLIYGRKLY